METENLFQRAGLFIFIGLGAISLIIIALVGYAFGWLAAVVALAFIAAVSSGIVGLAASQSGRNRS